MCSHRGRRDYSSWRGFIRARLGVVPFIRVRVCFLGRAYDTSGSFEFAWVHSGAPSGGRVHSGLRGFNSARLGVVGFIQRSHGFTLAHLKMVGFIWDRACSLRHA